MPAKKDQPQAAALKKFEERFAKLRGDRSALRRTDRIEPYPVVSTGSLALDIALGVGGLVIGRIHEVWGPEGGGKTTVCLNIAAQAQKLFPNRMIGYIDMEQSLDLSWAQNQGVDLTKVYHDQPDSAEDVADDIEEMANATQNRDEALFSVLFVDSIGGMISEAEWAKTAAEDTVGQQAKIVTRMVKKSAVLCRKQGITVVLVNQVRANIGGYGATESTGGGWALRHGTTTKMKARKSDKLLEKRDGDNVEVGIISTVRIERNKVAPANRSAEVKIIGTPSKYGSDIGISRFLDIATLAPRFGVIPQTGPGHFYVPDSEGEPSEKVEYEGPVTYVNGSEKLQDFLRARPGLADDLYEQTVEANRQQFAVEADEESEVVGSD